MITRTKTKTSFCAITKRLLLIPCLVASVLLGTFGTIGAQSHISTEASDHLIVPAVRIGPVFLGMTETQLYTKLGDPNKTMNNGPYICYYYPTLSVAIQKTTGKIIQVTADSPIYSTSEGVKVGSSLLEMKAKLVFRYKGSNNVDEANADYHTGRGLSLGVTNGRIRAIWIH